MPSIQGDAEVELINLLARGLQCGAATFDADLRLRYADPQARALLGLTTYEDAATRWRELVLQAGLAPARLTAAAGPLRLSAQPTAGPALQLEIQPLTDGYLALLRASRQLGSLELELLAASRMYTFNGLAGALAHDFRGPLNAMQLTLELLSVSVDDEAGGAPGGADPIARRRRYIAVLKQELARLNPRLQALLGFNEPLDAPWRSLDLRELTQETTALLESLARRQRITLDIQLPEQAMPLTGGRAWLKQALLIITLSAFESMPDGGQLRLRADAAENRHRLTVYDTGPGLPRELLAEMQAFTGAAPRSNRGTSLYIARRVAEAHGGALRIGRAPETGDCYELLLPYDSTPAV